MICKNCTSLIERGALFCGNCGQEITGNQDQLSEIKLTSGRSGSKTTLYSQKQLAIGAFSFIVLGGIITFFFLNLFLPSNKSVIDSSSGVPSIPNQTLQKGQTVEKLIVESTPTSYSKKPEELGNMEDKRPLALVNPRRVQVAVGELYEAQVYLNSCNENEKIQIALARENIKFQEANPDSFFNNADKIKVSSDGIGSISIPADNIGLKKRTGVIKSTSGAHIEYHPFTLEYEVTYNSQLSATAIPSNMNVLYRGIENPIEISVSGIKQEALNATISTGSLTKKPDGSYIANIKTGKVAIVSVTTRINGETKNMGRFKFRLKSVPDPVAKFAGKTSVDNTVKKGQLNAALGVSAELKDFAFDLSFPVRSFDITVVMGGDVKTLPSASNRLTNEQKELLREVRRNQVVIVKNIKATAPDGTIRKLGSICLRVI